MRRAITPDRCTGMPSSSSAPCTVPSSPPRPCSAMNTRAKPSARRSAQGPLRRGRRHGVDAPRCAAPSTPRARHQRHLRSALVPPISTATLPRGGLRSMVVDVHAPPPSPASGTAPIEPAPMAMTTSPSRGPARDGAAAAATSSTNTGSTAATRNGLAPAPAVGGRRSALRRRRRPRSAAPRRRCRSRDEILEAVARGCSGAAGRPAPAAAPGRRRARASTGHLHRVVAVVVDQREAPTARRQLAPALEAPADARKAASARCTTAHRAVPVRWPPRSRPARCARCARRAGSA